jgi:hypothetical protein
MAEITAGTLVDIEHIRRVIILYSQLMDELRFGEWRDLFTEDAEFWSIPGHHLPGGHEIAKIVGREAIVTSIEGVERRMMESGGVIHFSASPVIDVDGQRAKAWWDFIIVHTKPSGNEFPFAGRYYADFAKGGDGRWRFSRRISVRPGYPLPEGIARTPGR